MGRLENRPMAQAPKACTIKRVSRKASTPSDGAMRMPETAARDEPMTHEAVRTRVGLSPVRASRAGSSTTARMAAPSRVRRKNTYSRAVSPTPQATVMIWAYSTPTPATSTLPAGRNCGNGRTSGPNTRRSSPWMHSRRPTVATTASFVSAAMNARVIGSSASPRPPPTRPTATSRAAGHGQPDSTCSTQKTKAAVAAMAPWAKLKMPDVL